MRTESTLALLIALTSPALAEEQCSLTIGQSIDIAEDGGGFLLDMIPVHNDPEVDNIILYQLPDSAIIANLVRGNCIVGTPAVSTLLIEVQKDNA